MKLDREGDDGTVQNGATLCVRGKAGTGEGVLAGEKCLWETGSLGSGKMLNIAKVGDELTLSMYITVVGTSSVSTRALNLWCLPLKTWLM